MFTIQIENYPKTEHYSSLKDFWCKADHPYKLVLFV